MTAGVQGMTVRRLDRLIRAFHSQEQHVCTEMNSVYIRWPSASVFTLVC